MKIYLLLVNFLLSATLLFASPNVWDYYRKVNLAELAICDSNFARANQYYKEAFSLNPDKPFFKDLTNAFYSAMDSHDYILADKYISRLLGFGVDAKYLSKLKKNYKGEDLKRLNAMLSRHHNNITEVQQSALYIELKTLYNRDQGVRDYFYTVKHLSDYMTDSACKVDAANAQALFRIIKENGFPSHAIAEATGYDIIILHNSFSRLTYVPAHIFDTLIYKAVLNFDFDARDFAKIVECSATLPSFQYGSTVLHFPLNISGVGYRWIPHHEGIIYPEYYNETSEQIIDKERDKIGLASLNDVRKKIEGGNKGLDPHSVLHKYGLTPPMNVLIFGDKTKLDKWLEVYGKDAPVKQPYDFHALDNMLTIGSIDDIVIGHTTYGELVRLYNSWLKSYNQGVVHFSDWQDGHAPLQWNRHALVVANPHENMATEAGRNNQARMVPGYQYIVDQCTGAPFPLENIEMLFAPDSLLISFKANTGNAMAKVVTFYCGKPSSYNEKRDTIPWPNNPKFNIILNTQTYTWQKGTSETIVTTADKLTKNGEKVTTTTYQIIDTPEYTTYLKRVNEEKGRLDKKYGKSKIETINKH